MKTVVVYSGGMDSYTLLHYLRRSVTGNIVALSFQYGQKHGNAELAAATTVCLKFGIEQHFIPLSAVFNRIKGNSALLRPDIAVPEGHYAASNMKQTIVPGRNTVMLSVALAFAEANGFDTVAYGAHAGDHHIYPDCRPNYIHQMGNVFREATEGKVSLISPFQMKTKGQILRIGLAIPGTNYADTWTCYVGNNDPCQKCGACTERAEAFAFCGIEDPLLTKIKLSEKSAI